MDYEGKDILHVQPIVQASALVSAKLRTMSVHELLKMDSDILLLLHSIHEAYEQFSNAEAYRAVIELQNGGK